jgi:ASC-1-like (ASCH) protein
MGEQLHELKTTDVYWDAVNCGEKTFEVRRNDRGFQKGDLLHLIRSKSEEPSGLLTRPIA